MAAILLASMPTACSMVPAYERPSTSVRSAWSAATVAAVDQPAVPSAEWWTHFGSQELDQLLAEALAANQDIAAALARIDQARANTRIAGAPLYPGIDGSSSDSRSRIDGDGPARVSTGSELQLSAGYEIDLWGKNRALLEAAESSLTATVYDKDALSLVLQSDVASTYFLAIALKERLTIARENLAAAREVLSLVEIQLAQGIATALDLAQQRSAVASFESQLPLLAQQLQAAQSSLAILLGRAPGNTAVKAAALETLALPSIAAGQPSQLLDRRPDIRVAEADLQAANADIGAARAAFYPSITLSASAALDGLASGGASTIATLAAALIAPIFSGGQLEGQLELSKARKEELVANYRQTVLTAFKEVEDTLTRVDSSAARAASLRRAADEAREAFRLAELSYAAGATDFLTVLDAQRTQLDSQDSLVQAELDRYTSAAELFKALGGGWQPEA